jgi:3-oxoacyl-[acyl-carrier protein] reductase
MGKLAGRRALISGSSSGIGRGVALAFAREGADVVVNFPDASQAANAQAVVDAIRALGQRAVAIEADVANELHVERLVDAALGALGGIDILVNNAGIASASPIETTPVEVWDRTIAVHLRSAFLLIRRVLPLMYAQDYGKIITTASQLAYKGNAALAHYTAAKGALISMTRSVALEIGPRNVNINCVAPGATHTPILAGVPPDMLEGIRRSIPKGRLADVDDIVPTYVFLASEDSRHFQGQTLSPNGGDLFL